MQDHITKENQLLVKEIALKYTTDSDTWNRQRVKLLEKEKLVILRTTFVFESLVFKKNQTSLNIFLNN